MGLYIETPEDHGKAAYLIAHHGAIPFTGSDWSDIPESKVAVCVVENGPFDAAGIAYDKAEFDYMHSDEPEEERHEHGLMRPRKWLLLSKLKAVELQPKLARESE